jgi:hypothetical protein
MLIPPQAFVPTCLPVETPDMELLPPSWFNQRQGKVEPAGTNVYRLTAPNLKETFLVFLHGEDGLWAASLRAAADGPDLVSEGEHHARLEAAWDAGFELYRTHVVT